MSQISKKPVSLPPRKRLKPTVNLNVASRRRKDVPSATDAPTEVQVKQSANKINSNEEYSKGVDDPPHSGRTEGKNVSRFCQKENASVMLNTTFESDNSITSAQTVLLQECGVLQEKNDTVLCDAFNSRDGSIKSVTSSVSTVLLQHNEHEISEREQRGLLDQSIDSVGETDYVNTSTVTVNSATMAPHVHETCNEKKYDMSSRRDESGTSNVSNIPQKITLSEPIVIDHQKDAEIQTLHSENETRKSVNPDCNPAILAQAEQNADLESLNDDSVSSVSENNSLRQDRNISLPKYKRKVSSMAKRISEAKRDFETRYSDKKPERSALKMFDLIYYNPIANPMSSPDKSKVAVHSKEAVVSSPSGEVDTSVAEEEVDNPTEEENLDDENDNGIPAPRVKVGPNGEIVLDEQSLVIETTQSKKSRQEIANLTVVVDTGSNTTYHTYSKKKRMRNEWSVKETIRFYKALQTLGTDFSLMQTLFPTRSRLDLKSKFKKEERINGHLIEKALRCPSLFDISELEKEPTVEEKEGKKKTRERRPRKRTLKALGFDEEDCGPTLTKKKRKSKLNPLHKRNCGKDTGKENVETQHDECTSDEEYHPPADERENQKEDPEFRKIRAKRNNGKTPDYAALENKHDFLEAGVDHLLQSSSDAEEENNPEIEGEVCEENTSPVIDDLNMDNVQPGSLVIVTAQCPNNPGYQICNVFMVQERPNPSCEEMRPPSTADVSPTSSEDSNMSTANTECETLSS